MNIALPVPISEYEAPEGWQVQPLSKLCAEVIERVDPITMNGDIGGHYIGLEHMGQGSGQLEGVGSAAEVVSQKSRFQAGNILFGKLRPNLRKVARPDFGGVCSTDIIVLRAKSAADPAFLFQVLQSEPLVAHAVATAAGTKMPRTHARSILSFEIAVPPLDEQRRIAEVLRSVDEAIAANRVAVDAARRTLEALAAEIVAEAPDTRAVADFGTVVTGGTPSPKNANLWDGDLPFVTPGDLDDECISVRDAARSLNASAPHRARVLPANSVLVTCIGSTVGKVAISRRECATNQQINAICCDPALAGYVYLACLAAYDEIVANAGKQAVPIINKSTFSGLSLPYFPRERMLEISEAVDALDDERERSVAALDRLTSTKTSMMTDLLSGRVRVPA